MLKRQSGWLISMGLAISLLVFAWLCGVVIGQENAAEAESRRVVLGFMKGRVQKAQRTEPSKPSSNLPKPFPNPTVKPVNPDPDEESFGFGLTIFLRVADAAPRRVAPTTIFRQGDGARLLIEPSAAGFLYIFHTENSGPARLIYPSPFLRDGANAVVAHRPYEIPSRHESQFPWFEFFGQPATERLYIVLARQPLPDVPRGQALAALCAKENPRCLWPVPHGLWQRLVEGLAQPAHTGHSREFGLAETAEEQDALARDFGLPLAAPAPTLVYLSKRKDLEFFLRRVDLIHK